MSVDQSARPGRLIGISFRISLTRRYVVCAKQDKRKFKRLFPSLADGRGGNLHRIGLYAWLVFALLGEGNYRPSLKPSPGTCMCVCIYYICMYILYMSRSL